MNAEAGIQDRAHSNHFTEHGFDILKNVLALDECNILATELSDIYEREQKTVRKKIGGIRNLLRLSPRASALAFSDQLKTLLKSKLGAEAFPVCALFFDKTPDANWLVPWHQDLTIAVAEKIETAEFGAWSMKDGILHVQPPWEILESMATLRIHLDDCNAVNGALKLIPRSHQHGKLTALQISEQVKQNAFLCELPKGSALLMRPLLLHSSLPAQCPSHRRVLHVEYATENLPGGLKWFDVE